MDIAKDIEKEIRKIELYKKIEESSLGGNVVKVAMYGGHIAGLRSALIRLQQNDVADKESEPLCLCPLHFGDCDYFNSGKCTSPLI